MRAFILFLLFIAPTLLQAYDDPKFNIIAQKPLSTQQGQPITIQLSDLTIENGDRYNYPDGFKLKIYEGDNYTSSDDTIYPSERFVGTLIVQVRVKKKGDESEKYDLKIEVKSSAPPPNVAPVITAQKTLVTQKNQPVTLQFLDLTVIDSDDTYPSGFSMTIATGENYTVNGREITPNKDYVGTLTASVIVNDGRANSAPFNLNISVTDTKPVNVAPIITAQSPISISKNTNVTIQFSHLIVTDPDDTYPSGFSMTIATGDNYTVNGRTITPNKDFVGTLTASVIVNDGSANSTPFNLNISVTDTKPVNVAPLITRQSPVTISKNANVTMQFSYLTVTDTDNAYPKGFTLIVLGGENYAVNGKTITPKADFVGTLNVPVQINDGKDNSPIFNFKIAVVEPQDNRPLVITGQIPLTTIVNQPITILLTHLVVSDPDNKYPNGFGLKIQPGNNYDVLEAAIIPATNFTGVLIVPVTVSNETSTSNEYNLVITVVDDKTLDIPTAFTPNNDNANDTWSVKTLKETELYENAKVRIYNKHGALLFESTGLEQAWDGTFNGQTLPADVYYFTVEVDRLHPEMNKKGTVTILR